jgi:hypothetical protein
MNVIDAGSVHFFCCSNSSVRINGSFRFQTNWKLEDDGAIAVLGMKGAEKRKLLRKRTGVGVVILHLIYALSHITTSHSVELTVIRLCKYAIAVGFANFFLFLSLVTDSFLVQLMILLGQACTTGPRAIISFGL